jgi:HEPN superfamily AbiU2-like protein
MFETWDTQKRISEAKRLTACLVDHTLYLLDIHENNAIVLYSDTLSKQIPKSYAANAFNVFWEAMHQIEVVRICALWDSAKIDKESILTVIELIDDQKVLDALADQARAQHAVEFGNQQAERANSSLKSAIKEARKLRSSAQLTSIRNLRDKHIAHYLTQTEGEKKAGPITPMAHGDERPVLDASKSIVEALNSWVNGVGLSFRDSQAIDRKCAEALWHACTFKIEGVT